MEHSNLYQCNSYDNSGFLTQRHSLFYEFSNEVTHSNISDHEHLVSFNNKENIPINSQFSQMYLTYQNDTNSEDYSSQKFLNEYDNQFLGSQGQVLSPFLGFENPSYQFSQPPVLSPNLDYENNQKLYSQPPVLSPCEGSLQTLVQIVPTVECETINSNIDYCNTQNIAKPSLNEYNNMISKNITSNFEIDNIHFVPNIQNSESELMPSICDTCEINSNRNNLDTSDNYIVLETPIKQVPENLNYDLILPLNPQRKDENLSVLKYLNDSSDSIDILKTPIKCTLQSMSNENVSPIKSVLKSKDESNLIKKSISFNPSTSVISNTGEETPSKYNASFSKNISSDFSPEMFSDDENDSCLQKYAPSMEESVMSKICTVNIKNKQDRLLLKKLQESFSGILPPPSVTICQLNAEDILNKYNQNKDIFSAQKMCQVSKSNKKSTMLINCDLSVTKEFEFPDIMALRYHGLHYNRSKLSEDIEHLCQKYSERFIGCETASSCTIWQLNISSSASKRRMIRKQQLCKSPGRRLSHLARRRITFSKENLNAKNSVLPSITMSSNQRMIGVKKNDILIKKRLSPCKKMISPRKRMMISPRKRKTPSKSPRKYITRTPNSTAKKRRRTTPCNENNISTSYTRNNHGLNSKRALFQSPDKKSATSSSTLNIKRKLFAKSDNTSEDVTCNRKRKRDLEDDDDVTPQRDKFLRSLSSNDIAEDKSRSNFNRRNSETVTMNSTDFSEHHTKKMLWAISTALRTQNIGMNHPSFKTYASILSQICKRLLSDLLPGQIRLPGSVNERMSKIAHQHVYAVVKGKTVDEIIDEVKKKSILSQKPKGYIAPDNFNLDDNQTSILHEKPILTTSTVESTENMNHLVINDNQKLNKSRIRRQIIFDKLI